MIYISYDYTSKKKTKKHLESARKIKEGVKKYLEN